MKEVTIYTDGACSGNPGPGGYGCVMRFGPHRRELAGGFRKTTNNRMEIIAAVKALEALKFPCQVQLYSDSRYLVNAMTKGWVVRWKSKNWVRTQNEPVKNPDLWQTLLELCRIHQVTFNWVRGHADNPENNRCDELATAACRKNDLPHDSGYDT